MYLNAARWLGIEKQPAESPRQEAPRRALAGGDDARSVCSAREARAPRPTASLEKSE
jgi:hypothetical protein